MRMNSLRPTLPAIMALIALLAIPALADVRLPKIFTDNMIFQRDQPIRVWGWAESGEGITVSLAGKTAETKADEKGLWSVELPALKDGENLELVVKGKNTLTLKNIIMGDIWICSGQSNMEMTLGGCLGANEDIKAADLPKIRRIKINHVQSGQGEPDAPTATPWQVCNPQNVAGFTAAGFYFAREISAKTGVPIGIVDNNWGGCPIEPWVNPEGLAAVEELKGEVNSRQALVKDYESKLPKALDELEGWIARTRNDLKNGAPTSSPPTMPSIPLGRWSHMYNAMLYPFVRMPIKGALWYQGETNGGEGSTYYDKMRGLILGWRKIWNQGDFPFYWVQLAPFQDVVEDPAGGNGWAKCREAQLRTLSVPNTGMAVITDTVPLAQRGDIHPKDKYDVGMRLASWALAKDYGQKDLVYSGPLFKELKIEGNKARIMFDSVGTGLMIGQKSGRDAATEEKAGKLKRFAIAGADKKWVWADAVIENNTVVVSSPDVKEPVAVRYAFQGNPDGANLYNKEGFPASPFRTDNW